MDKKMTQQPKQLTIEQHTVPRFYLAQWAKVNGKVVCHLLHNDSVEEKSAKVVTVESWFYEEDATAPDNRIENQLGKIENASAPVFKKIESLASNDAEVFVKNLKENLTAADLEIIMMFAAYQYLRVEGVIKQKGSELDGSAVPRSKKIEALNPGRFVEEGFDYIWDKFKEMDICLMVSREYEFITSDWPCFDVKDSDYAALVGEEIGEDPEVACYFPISPRVAILFHMRGKNRLGDRVRIKSCANQDVRNANALIVQIAEKVVIASKARKAIFSERRRRSKAQPLPPLKRSRRP